MFDWDAASPWACSLGRFIGAVRRSGRSPCARRALRSTARTCQDVELSCSSPKLPSEQVDGSRQFTMPGNSEQRPDGPGLLIWTAMAVDLVNWRSFARCSGGTLSRSPPRSDGIVSERDAKASSAREKRDGDRASRHRVDFIHASCRPRWPCDQPQAAGNTRSDCASSRGRSADICPNLIP